MLLVDALPKDEFGNIIAIMGEAGGEYYMGTVGTEWFKNVFPQFANAELPCEQSVYEGLKAVDKFWFISTVSWRKTGAVQVQGIAQDTIIEEEEAIVNPPIEEVQAEEGGAV